MRKWTIVAVIVAAVLWLSQCSLFSHDVKYTVVSEGLSSPAVSILYNNSDGKGVTVQTNTPWTETFTVYPTSGFVAALRVTNNGATDNVSTKITVDGTDQGGTGSIAPGATFGLFYWVD